MDASGTRLGERDVVIEYVPDVREPALADPRPRRGLSTGLARLLGRGEVVVFAIAVLARLAVVLRRGGLTGLFGYDSGVYFGGADSLVHGRLPYLDYVQVHPPMITLALAPFAMLTKIMSDSAAFSTTIVAFSVLGGINAVLVMRVARRLGLGGAAAWGAGLFTAVWLGSVDAEYLIKLEPLANLFLLLALLLALRAERSVATWLRSVVAGVPLGLAVSVKIWLIVPVLAIMAWHAWRLRAPRRGAAMFAGACAAAVVVNGPFFVAAPHKMWSMVIADQVSRPHHVDPLTRLELLSSVGFVHGRSPLTDTVFVIIALLVVCVGVAAWWVRVARPFVALAAGQLVVVLLAPSFFGFYCDYLAVAAALVVAGAVSQLHGGRQRLVRAPGAALVAVLGAVAAVVLATGAIAVRPFPAGPDLARAVAGVPCVMSDSPAAQLRVDALSRGLEHGCPNWVDVTGPTYGRDRYAGPRTANPKWQRDFVRYLRHGQAVLVVRGAASGVGPKLRSQLRSAGAIATSHGTTVWRLR